jgi:hypothetical protein
LIIVVRQGDKYGPEYPELIRKMAKKTSGLPVFVLGDGEDADIPLEYGWTGWFAKMELYRPDLPRPFIYVDLDSLIVDDISHLLDLKGRHIAEEWHPRVDWCGKFQSSCMVIEENPEDIWESWNHNVAENLKVLRDQKFIEHFHWDILPKDTIGSYRLHSRDNPSHRIVTFHGNPKPFSVESGWVPELIKSYD